MKVLISDNLHEAGVAVLEAQPNIEVVNRPGLKPEELMEVIKDADALVIRSATKVTAELIAAAPRLKVVGPAGSPPRCWAGPPGLQPRLREGCR